MNTLDLLILAGLVFGLLLGLRSGLVKQVASAAGLVLAFMLAMQLMEPFGRLVGDSLNVSERIAPLLGFALVFIAIQMIVFAVVRLVESLIGVLKMSFVNRILGAGVGAFKAALIFSVVFLVVGYLGLPDGDTRRNSAFYTPISSILPTAWNYVSDHLPRVQELSEAFGDRVNAEVDERRENEIEATE